MYTLFDGIVSNSYYTVSNVVIVVNDTRKGRGEMRSWCNVRYCNMTAERRNSEVRINVY
jgi:hypothetical protein